MVDLPTRGVEIGGLQISNPPSGDYILSDLNIGGKPDVTVGDKSRPREDGLFFGRDMLTGRNITIEGSVSTVDAPTATDAWNALTTTWSDESVRLAPGETTTMRIRMAGGATRVVYGRPREIDPKDDPGFGLLEVGRIDFAAQFRCIDHLFYDDVEQVETFTIASSGVPGLRSPLRSPLTSRVPGSSQDREGFVTVGGTKPAYPQTTIYGPIVNPTWWDVGNGWLILNLTLKYDDYVTISTAPWNRGVRLNGITNVAGALTANSLRLSQARLDPGNHQLVLRGISDTGSARMVTSWRNAFSGT